jgi:hypothetical protein
MLLLRFVEALAVVCHCFCYGLSICCCGLSMLLLWFADAFAGSSMLLLWSVNALP